LCIVGNVRYEIGMVEESNQWVAKEIYSDGVVFYGYGTNPSEAMLNISYRNESLKGFNTFEVINNHVRDFISDLGNDDVCSMCVSTDILLGVTEDGTKRVFGDKYMALVAKKSVNVPSGYILQSSVDYPAKKVFEYFKEVK